MTPDTYPEWTSLIEQIVAAPGVLLVVGAPDTGKTTFCALLASEAHRAGLSVAVVDADVGQSEIGPPTCVGAGRVTGELHALSEIRAEHLAFVGSNAPSGRLLELAAAVRATADAVRATGPDLVIVDTTGFVAGIGGLRLKQAKIDLLHPAHVVIIQRGDECEPLARTLRFARAMRVHKVGPAKAIGHKPAGLRSQRRMGRLARYFAEATLQTLNLEDVALSGTWLGGGTVVEPQVRLFLERTLGATVLHAETSGRHLGVVLRGSRFAERDLAPLLQDLRIQAMTIAPAARYRHLVVGLTDGDGTTQGIGLIESLDFSRMQIGILTPVRVQASVRGVRLGLLRVQPDGKEAGTVRLGDV